MKDILIIAHFIRGTIEGRFEYIANRFVDSGNEVELITSDFYHDLKKHRSCENFQYDEFKFKLTTIHEIGYHRNITIRRFYSHFLMSKNLEKYLSKRKKPSIIYCSVPSLDVGYVVSKYAKKNNIKLIIDIQDLWPEAFQMVFHAPVISDLIFYPFRRQARFIYSSADYIFAVSRTYADRALKISKNKDKGSESVFLGTKLLKFDEYARKSKTIEKPANEIWLTYIGTLGHSYDLTCVFDALKLIKDENYYIKFIIMGDGPLRSKFEEYAKDNNLNVYFTGKLSYENMIEYLMNSDIAINPISHGAAQSIINKHGDYAAAGLPVVNTQESDEYRSLVENYKMGLNCENGNVRDLADKLEMLCKDQDMRKNMGKNSRYLAETMFDRDKTYEEIFETINNI